MEIAVLHSTTGDYSADFQLDDEQVRQQCQEFVNDMLRKGFALFLEQDGETHRILGYDPSAKTFEFIVRTEIGGTAKIQVKEERHGEEAPRKGGRKGRVTAVAPTAGG